MKRLSYLLALSLGLTAIVGVEAVNAALQPNVMTPAFGSMDEVLLANRLRNRNLRFRVRSSRYRRGGFSRGSCPEGPAPIVPEAEDTAKTPIYLTASTHPTFFINVPEMPGASGVLYVEEPESDRVNPQLYKAAFDLTGKAGIVGIKMPDDAPMLQEQSDYRWRVVISCSAEDSEEDTVVFPGGSIQRVADIEGTPEEKFDYYLGEGIWQEVAAIIAADRYYNASLSADEDWALLMEDAGLSEYAATPIVEIVEATLPTE